MEKIASFTINHNKLQKGMYISRIDDDIITYDIRMKLPNSGDYLDNKAMHTFEHLFATYARNCQYKSAIIYIGPMGCRTGFYFLTRNTISKKQALEIVRESLNFTLNFNNEIPGASKIECGNYLEHDLNGAKAVAKDMMKVLQHWTEEKMTYEQ